MKEIDYERTALQKQKEEKKVSWNKKVLPLRTYESDVKELMGEGTITKTTIIVAEQKKRQREEVPVHEESGLGRAILIVTMLFILLSLIALYTFFGFGTKRATVTLSGGKATGTSTLPAVHNNAELITDISSKAQLIADLRIFLEKHSLSGGVEPMTLISNNGAIPWDQLLYTISPSHPKELSLEPRPFQMGGRNERQEIYMIIKSKDTKGDLAALLSWEPNMIIDLPGVFSPRTPEQILRTYSELRFQDEYISDTDVRVARTRSGDAVFVYGYIDQDHVLFSPSIETYKLVIELYRIGNLDI